MQQVLCHPDHASHRFPECCAGYQACHGGCYQEDKLHIQHGKLPPAEEMVASFQVVLCSSLQRMLNDICCLLGRRPRFLQAPLHLACIGLQ